MKSDDLRDKDLSNLNAQCQRERARARCQPIASLAQRKRQYWAEVISALGPLGIVALIGFALCFAAVKFAGASWLTAALVCAIMMAPPIWMLWPDYPTQDDVERDRALRRSAGLPDNVEQD